MRGEQHASCHKGWFGAQGLSPQGSCWVRHSGSLATGGGGPGHAPWRFPPSPPPSEGPRPCTRCLVTVCSTVDYDAISEL